MSNIFNICYHIGCANLLRYISDNYEICKRDNFIKVFLKTRMCKVFQVLTYHRVSDVLDGISDSITSTVFEMQMKHIAQNYKVLPLIELVERAEHGTLPNRAVGISFDDGYLDNYTNAFPVLKKYGFPATIFLATGSIGTNIPLWYDQINSAFLISKQKKIDVYGHLYLLDTIENRNVSCQSLLEIMKALPENEKNICLVEVLNKLVACKTEILNKKHMLNWDQVREMNMHGIDFGAHTVSHPILSQICPDRQKEEICKSIKDIENNLKVRPKLFAYPNGRDEDYDDNCLNVLEDQGIVAAFTTKFGNNNGHEDRYRKLRGAAWDSDEAKYALQMAWYRLVGDK